MKKLILLASIALAAAVYQPVKAQVSVNINIGARPYYEPRYYVAPPAYYVPARVHHHRTVVVQRPVYVQPRMYRSHYAGPKYRYHPVKYHHKHGRGHHRENGRGRH
jgi:hypothetical protein